MVHSDGNINYQLIIQKIEPGGIVNIGPGSQRPRLHFRHVPDDPTDVFNLLHWSVRLGDLIGQDAERDALLKWARGGTAEPRMQFLIGPGGAGKSRLAAEIAKTLLEEKSALENKWDAGFLEPDTRSIAYKTPALLIFDYPEEHTDFFRQFLLALKQRREERVRVLVLTRRPPHEWLRDVDATRSGHMVEQLAVPIVNLSENDAYALYASVLLKLHNGIQVPDDRDAFFEWMKSSPSTNTLPLFVTAAAIYSASDESPRLTYGTRVIEALVRRERNRLYNASMSPFSAHSFEYLASISIVRGGLETDDIKRLALEELELGLPSHNAIIDALRSVQCQWWDGAHWPSATPDIVAAALMFSVLLERQDMAPEWLWAGIVMRERTVRQRLARLVYDIATIYGGTGASSFLAWLIKAVNEERDANRAALLNLGSSLAVAQILADLELDAATITTPILQELIESTNASGIVARQFGPDIADLVESAMKITNLSFLAKEDDQIANMREMFLATAKDTRIIFIKLADRLQTMRRLASFPLAMRESIAKETREIFAPIAHRLGIWRMKWELDDLTLRYLDPIVYRDIAERVGRKRSEREKTLAQVIAEFAAYLERASMNAEVTGYPRHFASLLEKMLKGRDFSTIGLSKIFVIVDTVRDCYGALGLVHSLWEPLPGRFRDYIAMPKPNLYQALHTTIVGPGGEALEVQIRTLEMHRYAEYGFAAYWRYKESTPIDTFEQKLAWLRSLLEWQNDMRESRIFVGSPKLDLFEKQVFVFSPKGDVYSLASGSTPLDFAYKVHTNVGNHCVAAKVNGKIVSLAYHLRNGDIAEVLLDNSSGRPSLNWLSIVKTSGAKRKIKQWLRKENHEENAVVGRKAVEAELVRQSLKPDAACGEAIGRIASRLNYTSVSELFGAIGFGDVKAFHVVRRLKDELKRYNVVDIAAIAKPAPARQVARRDVGIRIAGVDDVLVRFPKCCRPVPGDPIVGFAKIGRRVSVHRDDCPNVAYMSDAPERILEAQWTGASSITHAVDIEIEASDRAGLVQDVLSACSSLQIQVSTIKARVHHDNALVMLTAQVRNLDHLHNLLREFWKLNDVHAVYRVTRRHRVVRYS